MAEGWEGVRFMDVVSAFPELPEPEFPVTTICGSMRYFDQMIECARNLTESGEVVIMPFSVRQDDEMKEKLGRMHRQKIEMANTVVVVGAYADISTREEIAFARELDIPVAYWDVESYEELRTEW